MIVQLRHNGGHYTANLTKPLDISISISKKGALAWSVSPPNIKPVKQGLWIGDVSKGAGVNFNNIFFNPHAHGTHTECVGHISPRKESINMELLSFFFVSKLITITPKKNNKDCIITKNSLEKLVSKNDNIDALIIRTLPNNETKKYKNYSKTNPPYLLKAAAELYCLEKNNIKNKK